MPGKLWFEPLVWMDYRLAVLLTVILPLVLLVWAFVQKNEAIQRLLAIYWRVSSLLAITVYLMIGAIPVSFLSSFLARILIPIGLWFWIDLNEELHEQSESPLKLAFMAWRWAVTVYSTLGALVTIPFLNCAFSKEALANRFCQVWFHPPFLFREYFHANSNPKFLGFVGFIFLIMYVVAFSYFMLVRLGKQGRMAAER
ncbi:hypothetical protein BST81_05965 [Leptolyngbya sp. 'hensonii']|uniref:DUF3177 family protein n=1 Tax=Leptolyngbya sp. 'hensonii' TaxID=1922337 RepID=UPI00094FC162|nr:DUF3177 family protein [Leptolyngbya sp. 'hensonii']OLP19302.1 hypothetical protein BST81_05965 [Leptolyngbya sp. 'hensonii']